ncbi:hypothetical protein pv_331 [Pithovirus sibericum]|uniref:Uncharacterized protein n=1 Tax=Pithovirus sibericum TaxID=1450746 RepID=W5S555_9VIRU|nr:hypothetical protein pv_331 [Pithovirus sibericum]AHH01898.1 hypothetical protein pv_331 [Pithovirus sibericum]
MEEIFILAEKLASKREKYADKLSEELNMKPDISSPKSLKELEEIGQNIQKVYESLSDSLLKSWSKIVKGGEENSEKRGESIEIVKLYRTCLERLLLLKISIYDVEISKVAPGHLIFHCRVRDLAFQARCPLSEICSLKVVEVYSFSAEQFIQSPCDLFVEVEQYNSILFDSIRLENFQTLLKCSDLVEYWNQRCPIWSQIEEKFKSLGFVIEPFFSEPKFENSTDLLFGLSSKLCLLYPKDQPEKKLLFFPSSREKIYFSFLFPNVKKRLEADSLHSFEVKEFHFHYSLAIEFPNSPCYIYTDCAINQENFSFDNFLSWFWRSASNAWGEYGYFQNGKFYNAEHISDWVSERKASFPGSVRLNVTQKRTDILSNPSIDLTYCLSLGEKLYFPFEYYYLTFFYDGASGSECSLSIEGYYNDEDGTRTSSSNLSISGTFLGIFSSFQVLINRMVEINRKKF